MFKCHYLKTGGRKHPGCLKNEKSISNLYENKKCLLKSVQYWLHNHQKCKNLIFLNLCHVSPVSQAIRL